MKNLSLTYLIYAFIGLVLGAYLNYLGRHHVTYVLLYLLPICFAFLFALAYDEKSTQRLFLSSFIAALITSIPVITGNYSTKDFANSLEYAFLSLPFFAYMMHCFHYAYHQQGSFQFNYKHLFEAVWSTVPQIVVAFIFTNLMYGLLTFSSLAFETLGSRFLTEVYFENFDLVVISNFCFFFLGLGIAKINQKVTYNLRFILLKMMDLLFPVLAVVTIIFSLMFITMNAQHLFDFTSIKGFPVLGTMGLFGILFFNAHFQDGEGAVSSVLLRNFYRVYRFFLLFITSFCSIHLLCQFYHELPSIGIVYLFMIFAYGVIYAISSLMTKTRETTLVTQGNIVIAITYMVFTLLFYNPLTNHASNRYSDDLNTVSKKMFGNNLKADKPTTNKKTTTP